MFFSETAGAHREARRSTSEQDYLFGDLLKSLRKTNHLGQQALANKPGVHRNTIWNREPGLYLIGSALRGRF